MELLLIAALVLVLGWYLWRKRANTSSSDTAGDGRGRPRGGRPGQREALDTVLSWQPQATRVLTTAERKVYNSLRLSLPDHIILAQVPLARFLKVPTRYSYSEWLRRVGLMCADLVVCDGSSQVVCVIDIRSAEGQENERAKARNERMDRVIRGANIPMHIWRENMLPTATAARNAVLGLPADTPLDVMPSQARPAAKVMDRGLSFDPPTDDDVVEQGEPPPSTWFDDLDSASVPLGSNERGNAATAERPRR
jgi:hypothetical protein